MKYQAPDSIEDAVAILSQATEDTRILAGGTDVIVQMNSEFIEPDLIVDIKKIDELGSIVEEDGGYRIGAAVSCAQMTEHKGLSKLWPGCVEAAGLIGSTQVQGRATIAGNLCNGSPAADSVPALVAAGALARIVGPDGTRDVPVEEVPSGPGTINLEKQEFLHSIFLPARPKHASDAYQRFIPRTEMDIAVVGVGVSLVLDEDGTCTDARVALGAVAKTVVLSKEAGQALIGTRLEEADLERLAACVRDACQPINDKRGTIEFRTKVAGVLAKRVASQAADRARAA